MKKIIALALASVMALSLVACGSSNEDSTNGGVVALSGTVSDFFYGVYDSYGVEERPGLVEVDELTFADIHGITADMYDEFIVSLPMMSALIDEIVVVKAKDGQVDAVVEKLQARAEAVKGNAFYPEHVELAGESIVISKGNYVMFAVGHLKDDMVEAFTTELG